MALSTGSRDSSVRTGNPAQRRGRPRHREPSVCYSGMLRRCSLRGGAHEDRLHQGPLPGLHFPPYCPSILNPLH